MTLPRMLPRKRKRDNRVRSRAHMNWVKRHRCCVPGCRATECDPSHVSEGVPAEDRGGQSLKPGDNWTWSLCRPHHREFDAGEEVFCAKYRVDAIERAREFWEKSPHRRSIEAKMQRAA